MTAPLRASDPIVVNVALGERSYDIHIGRGLLALLGQKITALRPGAKVAIVTDETVMRHHLAAAEATLAAAGITATSVTVPPGESSKSFPVLERVCEALIAARVERADLVLALGGGVIGDLAGFAASVYQRGIPYVQVPTTLVAQVDSSVGGKTGVDHRLGKNLIGAFHQPKGVIIDPFMLHTLPRREWIAGLAEVIKYGIIADEDLFSFLEASMPELLKLDAQAVMRAVARSCEIKAEVVAEDEKESDRRRILNYGHTIGHALESLGGYRRLIHGEAVGIGLVAEADLAVHLGICGKDVATRIRRLVQAAGLPDQLPSRTSFGALWGAMQHDKKVVGGNVVGVWPVRLGEVVIRPLAQEACATWFRTLGSPSQRRKPAMRKT